MHFVLTLVYLLYIENNNNNNSSFPLIIFGFQKVPTPGITLSAEPLNSLGVRCKLYLIMCV